MAGSSETDVGLLHYYNLIPGAPIGGSTAIARHMLAAALAGCWFVWAMDARAQQLQWSQRPYRIHAVLAVDGPGGSADDLAPSLSKHLGERAKAAVGPLWELEIKLAAGIVRHRVLNELEVLAGDPAEEFGFEADKLVLLGVRRHDDGYELTAREFDRYVERWGPTLHRQTRQQSALAPRLFDLLSHVVAPLAQLELDPEEPSRVIMIPRGAALPSKLAGAQSIRPGDALLPILRRTGRNGELLPEGVRTVPWTYIESTDIREDGTVVGRIHSGMRRPLGVRRRGRVEQVAIAVRAGAGETIVHLVSRSNPDDSLAGYEVHSQNVGQEESTLIGVTDRNGEVRVSPGATSVQLLTIKNGGEALVRLPIVPGAEPHLIVQAPENDARLHAEMRLNALREELVDVVARRNILLARARQKIEAGDFKKAQELVTDIDQLPGRSYFGQELGRERRLRRAGDPQTQRRIDQQITATEVLLNQFLDARPIRELQQELLAAQSKLDDA